MLLQPKAQKIIACLIILAALVLAVVGYFVLPDVLVVQVSSGGAGNTMAKLPALLIPFAISLIFSILFYRGGQGKMLIGAGVGILAAVMTFIFNI